MSSHRRRLGAISLATMALAAACGGSSGGKSGQGTSPSPSTSSSVDAAAAAMVPASIKSDGVITVGTDSSYAPNEYLAADGKTVIGFDVDLFNAVAAKLGLRTKYVSAVFGTIIQGVQSGKFEAGVSSFTIRADREKQANMISYFSAGTQWATQKGNPAGVQPDSACGKKVAVQANTVQVDDLNARSKTCKSAGKPAITIDQYTLQDRATAALVSKKDEAMLADSPVVEYAVKQTGGQLQLLGNIYASAPYGYVVAKEQTQFAQAILLALKDVMADGTYTQVINHWGLEGTISNPEVNPMVS